MLMGTSTLGQVELRIELPTFQFVDNLHEPLSLCRPLECLIEFGLIFP